eukprot:scaffold72819_cov17-Tisochrysis_lutea.AAC.1
MRHGGLVPMVWYPLLAGTVPVGQSRCLRERAHKVWFMSSRQAPCGRAASVTNYPRPAKPLEIYEFELCPFCKKYMEDDAMPGKGVCCPLDRHAYPSDKHAST